MPSYIISPEAVADLREAFAYIEAESPRAADALEAHLRKAFMFLAEWPETGRHRPELGPPPLKFRVSGRYLIAYLTRASRVEIVAVLHAARDVPTILSERRELPPAASELDADAESDPEPGP